MKKFQIPNFKYQISNTFSKIRNWKLEIRNSRARRELGFTLVELLLSLAISLTISSIGVVAYVSYTNSQKLQNATYDVMSVLQLARSRAQSQVKVEQSGSQLDCTGLLLDGYKVAFSPPRDYSLSVLCKDELSASVIEKTVFSRQLSYGGDITFVASQAFTFAVLTGDVTPANGSVGVSGFGVTKDVVVSSFGTITVQ